MKQLIIADYIGNCTIDDKPSGHLLKLITEISCLLQDDYTISLILADNYAANFPSYLVKDVVPHLRQGKNALRRIFQRYRNINKILKNDGKIFFINTDSWFYIFISLMNIKNKEIYALNYIDYASKEPRNLMSKISSFFYEKGNKKLKGEFITQKKKYKKNQVIVPDYYFDLNKYEKYMTAHSEPAVLFCGTISRAKDVIGLTEVFIKNRLKLTISGKFQSDTLYNEIKALKSKSDNIIIENKRLSDDEYYQRMAENDFIVLPYKKACYSGRSSGVILEAVFLDRVIIAPDFLLEELGICGISYTTINELETLDLSKYDKNAIIAQNRYIKVFYSKENVRLLYTSTLT